jgi:hypothetical protein
MANAWILIACLVALRGEFDGAAPRRDKGADGAIGDRNHSSSSDHTPDEDSDVLRDHDPDDKNEVHALDVDSDGPWPDGSGREAGGWFDRTIRGIAARERAEYLSADTVGRLQNIIWRRQIISRSWGWSEWRPYTGASAHLDHAHFSARYLTQTESDTRPWGVAKGDNGVSKQDVIEAFKADVFPAPSNAATAKTNPTWRQIKGQTNQIPALAAAVKAIGTVVGDLAKAQGRDVADLRTRLDALSKQVDQVDDATAEAIFGGSDEQLVRVLVDALGTDRAAELGRLLAMK